MFLAQAILIHFFTLKFACAQQGGEGERRVRGAPGRPREVVKVMVEVPPLVERERVAQQPRNSAKAPFTTVSLVISALIFLKQYNLRAEKLHDLKQNG